jgi:4-alpha-glucanotransferase
LNNKKDEFAIGIIDNDKRKVAYIKDCKEIIKTKHLILFKHKERNQYLITISPAADGFILDCAIEQDIDVSNFDLPTNLKDFLKETNQTCWQILPLNPTSYGDSPYQSPSSLAGNPYFIDLDLLYQEKLLTKDELKENINKSKNVDYGWLFNTRFNVLRKAFNRFVKNDDYYEFLKRSDYWLTDYAKFMALKEKNNYKDWLNWDVLDVNEEDLEFWYFIQYLFDKQWNDVLKYAHDNGITIIGDMPIYVALDSVDVWMNKSDFLLDKDNYPTLVAGCPPDGFSPDGQLWGNPLYITGKR